MLNTSRYRIVAVGKIKKQWIKNGIDLYIKRLPGLKIHEVRDSNPQKEGESIKSIIQKDEKIIALNERGIQMTSINFASLLQQENSNRSVFVIGGADGLSPEINATSSIILSISPMTLPHEIARLILLEQIYRAQTIIQGGAYHR